MRRSSPETVEGDLVVLNTMDSPALRQRWRDLYGTEPPAKIKSGLLRLAIAYRIQERALGGLKAGTRRQLQTHGAATGPGGATVGLRAVARLAPGTQLMREWNGNTLLVDVIDDGFRWKDTTYRTLSAVAVAITGTKWSGPKFFGLASGFVERTGASP